jgi:DNA-binding response OmpR family regulator
MFDFLKDKSVLYVEDELDVLENISELLKNYFKEFYTASDGKRGYDIFLEHNIDLLLVDIELPKMNGIELINKIRQKNKNIHIIVISAYTKTDYLIDCIEYKIDKYIIKPLTSRKIKELLTKLNEEFKATHHPMITLDEEFSFDVASSQLISGTEMVNLTKKERELLTLFLANRNSLLSFMTMECEIWPEQESSSGKIRSLVSRLRSKLKHKFIETCSAEGYIFRV